MIIWVKKMGRPTKIGLDYFFHYVNSGKTIFVLENKFGNDGYAFWFKLLELLCSQRDLCYRCENSADVMFIGAKTKVSDEKCVEILNVLSDLDAIDRDLWKNNRVVWVQKLVDGLDGVFKKRNAPLPEKPICEEKNSFRSDNEGFRSNNSGFRSENTGNDCTWGAESTQSRVDESRVDTPLPPVNGGSIFAEKNVFSENEKPPLPDTEPPPHNGQQKKITTETEGGGADLPPTPPEKGGGTPKTEGGGADMGTTITGGDGALRSETGTGDDVLSGPVPTGGSKGGRRNSNRAKSGNGNGKNGQHGPGDNPALMTEFEIFRTAYPGTRGGFEAEFGNFKKKYKDWEQIVPLLLPALENQMLWRKMAAEKGRFVPELKHLKTWINNRGWEQEDNFDFNNNENGTNSKKWVSGSGLGDDYKTSVLEELFRSAGINVVS